MDKSVYGAHFNMYVQYEGSIQGLGAKLESGLNIPDIRYENREDEPYDVVGYAEILGFEIQLEEIKNNLKWPGYSYKLEATTMDSFEEQFDNRMHDISYWAARYISMVCEIITLVENEDNASGQLFHRDKDTLERESRLIETEK